MHAPDSEGCYANGIAGEVRVARDRDLEVGDELTFFYPSTEWGCARPFDCVCGAGEDWCIGVHRGAEGLSKEVMERYFVNKHIRVLVAERDGR